MKFEFIRAEKRRYSVQELCRVLSVSQSGYYAWLGRAESQRASENRALLVEIRAIYASSRRCYGAPRIHRELRDACGSRVGRHRVARLMRADGLRGRCRRRYRVTTDSNHHDPIAENRVARKFETDRPNRVWVGDVTYIRTGEGWLYLAVLLDL